MYLSIKGLSKMSQLKYERMSKGFSIEYSNFKEMSSHLLYHFWNSVFFSLFCSLSTTMLCCWTVLLPYFIIIIPLLWSYNQNDHFLRLLLKDKNVKRCSWKYNRHFNFGGKCWTRKLQQLEEIMDICGWWWFKKDRKSL